MWKHEQASITKHKAEGAPRRGMDIPLNRVRSLKHSSLAEAPRVPGPPADLPCHTKKLELFLEVMKRGAVIGPGLQFFKVKAVSRVDGGQKRDEWQDGTEFRN